MEFLEPDLLRTFLAFADGGSLARASVMVGRSASAVTAQMQRLEEMVGEPLIIAAGRGRILTLAGEELAGHARRILDVHRHALLSLRGARTEGQITLAATQDFADSSLPPLLRLFCSTHPRIRLDLRIGRSMELNTAFENGEIDILIAMRARPSSGEVLIFEESMIWMSSSSGLVAYGTELPLALLDPPCGFRSAAISALDQAKRPYRIAATSASLAGLRTAVSAGLAVTLRTARWVGAGIGPTPDSLGLPAMTKAIFAIRTKGDTGPHARDLANLMAATLPFSADPVSG